MLLSPKAKRRSEYKKRKFRAEIAEGRKEMYQETKCSNCGTTTNKQPAGDGCHSCQRGTMEKTGR